MIRRLKQILCSQKHTLLIGLFFSVIVIGLFAPIASNEYLPQGDYMNHVGMIAEAKLAFLEGQFPVRIAPGMLHEWRYPLFQFYSPLPYTIAGMVNSVLDPSNPYVTFKFIGWLALVFAGIYVYRLIFWLTNSPPAAFLAGVTYLFSPYIIINLDVRGDFTEIFAQGILPAVLYYTLKCYFEPVNIRFFFLTAFAWFALATSHLITFGYSTIFIGFLIILITCREKHSWRQLLFILAGYCYGCVLALWFLAPVVLIHGLSIYEELYDPYIYSFLTPIAGLLSPIAVSPMPQPGNGLLTIPLYPAVGWPILIGVVTSIYALTKRSHSDVSIADKLILPTLILFGIAFFATWSPIDFWHYLPKFFSVEQYSYRLLTTVTWLGTLIFAWTLLWIFGKKLNTVSVVVGTLIIVMATSSWIPTQKSITISPKDAVNVVEDRNNYTVYSYSIAPELISPTNFINSIELPLVTGSGWLMLNRPIQLPYSLVKDVPDLNLNITGRIPEGKFTGPVTLAIQVNNQIVASKKVVSGDFAWDISFAKLLKFSNARIFELQITADKTFFAEDNILIVRSEQPLAVSNTQVKLTSIMGFPAQYNLMDVSQTQNQCQQKKITTVCTIEIFKKAVNVQLPLFYYPDLLSVKVNDTEVNYFPTLYKNNSLVSLHLQPGKYQISAYFRGYWWANCLSGLAWIIMLSIGLKRKLLG